MGPAATISPPAPSAPLDYSQGPSAGPAPPGHPRRVKSAMRVSEIMTEEVVTLSSNSSLDEAMERLDLEDVRHLPVLADGRVVGIVSDRDVLEASGWLPKALREALEAPATFVVDFMRAPVVTIAVSDSVAAACRKMSDWGIGCLPVLDDSGLVGIVSETDVLNAFATACRTSTITVNSDPLVASLMSTEVVSTGPETPAEEAFEFCRSRGIRHLPLLEAGRLVGIVSDRDLRLMVGRGQLEGTPLRELAPRETRTIGSEARASRAAQTMVTHRIGALPVVDGDLLLGILTSADLITHCAAAFAKVGDAAKT